MSKISFICSSLPSSIRDAVSESVMSSMEDDDVRTVNLDTYGDEQAKKGKVKRNKRS